MNFKIGDKVKFLNDTGGGIITKSIDKSTVLVEIEDGFELPVLLSELVYDGDSQNSSDAVYDVSAFNKQGEEIRKGKKKPVPPVEDDELAEEETESGIEDTEYHFFKKEENKLIEQLNEPEPEDATEDTDTVVSVLCAFTHSREKGNSVYNLYLINDCQYSLLFNLAANEQGSFRHIKSGALEGDTKFLLGTYTRDKLDKITGLRFELILLKTGKYRPQEPLAEEIKIDTSLVCNLDNYTENDYFDGPALTYYISSSNIAREMDKVSGKNIREIIREKEPARKKVVVHKNKQATPAPDEVDLHIEKLVDTYKSLDPKEIMDIQLAKFEIALEGAIRNHIPKIVFIHGIGNGRLKFELRKCLDQKYPQLKYQDASFREYGYGATIVLIK